MLADGVQLVNVVHFVFLSWTLIRRKEVSGEDWPVNIVSFIAH